MDYQKFLKYLPSLYEDWGKATIRPKSPYFQQIIDQLGGTTAANVLQLLNFAVACLEPEEVYCEVGCSEGINLIGALVGHPDQIAYAVDNFSDLNLIKN